MAALTMNGTRPSARRAAVRVRLWAILGAAGAAALGCTAQIAPRVDAVMVGGRVVEDAAGEVELVRAGSASSVRPGTELVEGDEIRTGPGAQAVLLLENGRVEVIVLESSEVRISSIFLKLGDVVVRILKKVSETFEVESDYGVAGAETTEFLVSMAADGGYRCAVIDGRVRVRTVSGVSPPVTLERGQLATGRTGARLESRTLERREYNDLVERVNAVERVRRPGAVQLLVPDLKGLDEAEAGRILAAQGLEVGRVEGRVTRQAAVGTVLDQTPAAGGRLRAGCRVRLVVEAEPTTVPGVAGLPRAGAERQLAAAGLRTGEVRYEITGRVPEGQVLRQQPARGVVVAVDSAVDLWVEAASALVPTLVRLDLQRAEAALQRAGLRSGRVDSKLVEGVADGAVLEQRPAAGGRVEPGTAVDLVVAERGVRVPSLIGASQRTFYRVVERVGLRGGRISERPERRAAGTIVDQSPRAGTLVRPGTSVSIVVAASCTVPNVYQMHRDAAMRAIRAAQLTPRIRQTLRYNPDTVTNQSPRAGSRVACGSTVYIDLGNIG